jgi:drug/metabolite transporter (DMT)-like permease
LSGEPAATRAGILFSLFALYIIWGSTYLGILIAIETIPPLLMAGGRYVLAGGILFAFLRLRGEAVPTARQWRGAGIVGLFLLLGGNGLVVLAEQTVASGIAAVAVGMVPIWTALAGGVFGQWPGRLEWLGLALGIVGVVLLNTGGELRASPLGALALLVGPICWAIGSTWSRRVELPKGLMASAAEMVVGGAAMLLVSLIVGERFTEPPSARSLLATAYLIAFGSLVAFSAYAYLLQHVRPALATSYAYVNPIVALALGAAFAGERFGATALVATVIILAAVGLVATGRSAPRPAAHTHVAASPTASERS